ncbi:hypothetical protein GQ457_11G031300 [Hibiscus cannabinus]
MFDLAINTTLESNPSRLYPCPLCANFPCPGNWVVRFLLVFGKEFPNFALLFIRVDIVEILASSSLRLKIQTNRFRKKSKL